MIAYIVAYGLLLLAVVLVGRYIYRVFTGKSTQCSCGNGGSCCSMGKGCSSEHDHCS